MQLLSKLYIEVVLRKLVKTHDKRYFSVNSQRSNLIEENIPKTPIQKWLLMLENTIVSLLKTMMNFCLNCLSTFC